MNNNCKNNISGIKCEVETCRFHTKDNCCDAGCIQVGPHTAHASSETACNTFEQKF